MKVFFYFFLFFSLRAGADSPQTDGSSGSLAGPVEKIKKIEKIKVTGSRIKRIDLEGLNPVVSFSAEELDNSGYHSIGDFLRDTNIGSFGVGRGTAGSAATGDSYTSINGEPALILINGLRVTKDPELHDFDLNQIPINAVEKIDVLKGGAGAIYGSDAIGGVINFIIKKDFSGAEVFGSLTPTLYPLYRGKLKIDLDDYLAGSEASAGVVFGDTGSNWSYIGNLSLRYQENIRMDQRQWSSEIYSPVSPYADFVDPASGRSIHINCPEDEDCRFDYTAYADLMPRYYQMNGFLSGERKLDNTTLYTQFLAGYKRSQYFFAPIPVSAGVRPPLQIPSDHSIPEVSGRAFKLSHRFLKAGRRDTPADYGMADLTLGARGYLSKIWDYDFSVKGAHIIKNRTEKNVLLRDKTITAIQTGAYKPLQPAKEGLKEAIYTARSKSNSSLLFSSLDVTGQYGGFDIASGLQAYYQRYQNKADKQSKAKNILSDAGSDGLGSRYVGSYYLEVVKKLQSDLELQLAWRADYYSDFGLTNFGLREFIDSESNSLKFLDYLIGTPKLAFRYQPDPQFILRGSLGSSFKAPELSSLYGSEASGFPWFFDTPNCIVQIKAFEEAQIEINKDSTEEEIKKKTEALAHLKKNKELIPFLVAYGEDVLQKGDLSPEQKQTVKEQDLITASSLIYGEINRFHGRKGSCHPSQYFTTTKSNKELKETRAVTASLGSAFELSDELNFSLDLIYIAKNDIPSTGVVDSTGIGKKFLDIEALNGKSALEEYGIITTRKEESGRLENVQTKYLNLAKSRKLFVDFSFNLTDIKGLSLQDGRAYWANNFTYFFIDKAEEFPNFGIDDLSGNYGRPRWRNASRLGWQNKKHHVFFKALTRAGFQRASDPSKYFPLHTRFDANYEYKMGEKTSFQLNVYNFLNLGINFKNQDEKRFSLSLDVPFDPNGYTADTRTDLDLFGINGAYFTVKVSHLL